MKKTSFLNSFSWWGPLLFLLLFAPFSGKWDLALSRFAYGDHGFSSDPFFVFFYDWGSTPALAITFIALIIIILGLFFPYIRRFRKEFLYLFLTFVIGSGLITNALLKDHWGRPRPKQVIEFGGSHQFSPFYTPNFEATEPMKSFPCGHCTTGFYFFSFVFLGRRLGKKWVEVAGWSIAFGLGLALSASRIFQGGHFLSDTIVGAIVMWYTALILDWLLYSEV